MKLFRFPFGGMKIKTLLAPIEGQPMIRIFSVSLLQERFFGTPCGRKLTPTARGSVRLNQREQLRGGLNESAEPGDIATAKCSPKERSTLSRRPILQRVSFQTQRRGVRLGTFEDAESVTQSKTGKVQALSLPFPISPKPEPICN